MRLSDSISERHYGLASVRLALGLNKKKEKKGGENKAALTELLDRAWRERGESETENIVLTGDMLL